ncbi:hypothetical protein [Escherichia coli]|uniref:hypothetical protein n=1 Tax=Escherichia coli TaxID=562 RepID=UPI00226474E5|nr:hypothetical protein [Escherichia coli]MCX8326468.1 hypothetical protein [Escherichia coli]
MSINEKHNKTNEMLTSQEVITATQKALAELINARKKVLSEMDDDNDPLFFISQTMQMENILMASANNIIGALHAKTLHLERELAELRTHSGQFSA